MVRTVPGHGHTLPFPARDRPCVRATASHRDWHRAAGGRVQPHRSDERAERHPPKGVFGARLHILRPATVTRRAEPGMASSPACMHTVCAIILFTSNIV